VGIPHIIVLGFFRNLKMTVRTKKSIAYIIRVKCRNEMSFKLTIKFKFATDTFD
jgi:hypothetical protein